jgi:stringent starvation protein B
MIHLDARRPGVLLPDHLKHEPHLLLNISYRFTPPDLTVSEWGVRETLTFSGTAFCVAVPWSALYAISSHATKEFWMYPDDMPPELLASQAAHSALAEDGGEEQPQTERAQAVLREVVMEGQAADSEGPKEPPRRGHLRLVK